MEIAGEYNYELALQSHIEIEGQNLNIQRFIKPNKGSLCIKNDQIKKGKFKLKDNIINDELLIEKQVNSEKCSLEHTGKEIFGLKQLNTKSNANFREFTVNILNSVKNAGSIYKTTVDLNPTDLKQLYLKNENLTKLNNNDHCFLETEKHANDPINFENKSKNYTLFPFSRRQKLEKSFEKITLAKVIMSRD